MAARQWSLSYFQCTFYMQLLNPSKHITNCFQALFFRYSPKKEKEFLVDIVYDLIDILERFVRVPSVATEALGVIACLSDVGEFNPAAITSPCFFYMYTQNVHIYQISRYSNFAFSIKTDNLKKIEISMIKISQQGTYVDVDALSFFLLDEFRHTACLQNIHIRILRLLLENPDDLLLTESALEVLIIIAELRKLNFDL